jgi:hypothetical protein
MTQGKNEQNQENCLFEGSCLKRTQKIVLEMYDGMHWGEGCRLPMSLEITKKSKTE